MHGSALDVNENIYGNNNDDSMKIHDLKQATSARPFSRKP